MFARLVVTTQIRENYGAHDWDGEGEPPNHWKNKGGNEYQQRLPVESLTELAGIGRAALESLADRIAARVERDDPYWNERVTGFYVTDDGETGYEADLRQMYEMNLFSFQADRNAKIYYDRLAELHKSVLTEEEVAQTLDDVP